MSKAQLGLISDLCERQVDVACDELNSCLFCGKELSLSALQGHVAAHMEDIALFVLPSTDEEEESDCSKASVQVVKLKSKGSSSDTESRSSLGFSVGGDQEQNTADFSNLPSSEEAVYSSKCSSWEVVDDDQSSASAEHDLPEDSVGNYLEDLDVDKVAPRYKKMAKNWHAIFNPATARVLDVELVHSIRHDSEVYCVKISHDGKYVATSCRDSAQIFDISSGEKVCIFENNSKSKMRCVRDVSFSPDGRYLAAGAQDNAVLVWEIQTQIKRY
ncbi:Transcriptional repressor rco-1 [Metarhizium anisopliae]|nr:Transcriptional repressor rco-1 [Metarhizium anisopliae]